MPLSTVIPRVSYSNVQTFLQCPHKWKLKYIDHIDIQKQSIELIFGTAVHEVIQTFLTKYYAQYTLVYIKQNRSSLIDEYFQLMMSTLLRIIQQKSKSDPTLCITDAVIETHLEYALKLLKQFIPNCNKWFQKQHLQLIGVQVELLTPINETGLSFKGYIDILLHNKKQNKYIIYDLKTSRMGWKDRQKNDANKRMQLLLYKYFLSRQLNVQLSSIDIVFLILKKVIYENSQYKISRLQQFRPPNASITVKKALNEFNAAILQMQKIVQNPTLVVEKKDSDLCKYCPYLYNKNVGGQILCDRNRTIKK